MNRWWGRPYANVPPAIKDWHRIKQATQMQNNNYKQVNMKKEERMNRIEAMKEWCYTSMWMNRYYYECENGCYYIDDPRHSVVATVEQLQRRWTNEQVPAKKWFEGVIYDEKLWRKIDVEEAEWLENCNQRYLTDPDYRAEQDALTEELLRGLGDDTPLA